MLISFIRTIILYLVLIAGVRLTGKRQLGDLEPAELILTILITEMAAVPLQDTDAPLLNSIVTIIGLVCIEIIFSSAAVRSPLFGKLLQGKYSVLVRDGKIDQTEMRKSEVSPDELSEALRQNGAVSPEEARYCILEASGKISVLLKKELPPGDIPLPVILRGKYINHCLKEKKLTKREVEQFLSSSGVKRKQVYTLTAADGSFTLILKENSAVGRESA